MLTQTRKPPTYRLHATGQAFVQWKGKRFYLGKHGSNESKERYSRFVAEVWSKPAPVQPTSPAPGTDFSDRSTGGGVLVPCRGLLSEGRRAVWAVAYREDCPEGPTGPLRPSAGGDSLGRSA